MLIFIVPAILLFIGRWYFLLARTYQRNSWVFALLGIGIFIASPFLFDMAARLLASITGNQQWVRDDITLFLLDILFAVASINVVYQILRIRWNKRMDKNHQPDLLDR